MKSQEFQKSNMNRMLMNLKVTKTMSKTNETMEKTEKVLPKRSPAVGRNWPS